MPGERGRDTAGLTRLGLDGWEMDELRSYLVFRYPSSNWDNMYRANPLAILAPGSAGPVATVRYEMLREGLQECEARIVVEKALKSNKLSGDMARRARDLLAERLKARLRTGGFVDSHGAKINDVGDRLWGLPEDWQQSSRDLYDMAGKAAAVLK
jgi:hypothetical protein